jgi:hypothetical protein
MQCANREIGVPGGNEDTDRNACASFLEYMTAVNSNERHCRSNIFPHFEISSFIMHFNPVNPVILSEKSFPRNIVVVEIQMLLIKTDAVKYGNPVELNTQNKL